MKSGGLIRLPNIQLDYVYFKLSGGPPRAACDPSERVIYHARDRTTTRRLWGVEVGQRAVFLSVIIDWLP